MNINYNDMLHSTPSSMQVMIISFAFSGATMIRKCCCSAVYPSTGIFWIRMAIGFTFL